MVIAALLTYVPSVSSGFFAVDDQNYVTQNEVLQQTPLAQWWRFFTTRTNPIEYLPLRDLSYRLDLALFGLDATGFRVHNLLLYGLTCASVWWLVITLLPVLRGDAQPQDRWVAAVATAIFAAHPAHVESVAWVSGRKDLLSGFFAMTSLALFARAMRDANPSWWRLAGAYALFACAILSKSTVVTVPIVAWLIAAARADSRTGTGPAVLRASAWIAPLLVLSGISIALQIWGSATYANEPFDGVEYRSLVDRLLLHARILGALVRVAALPLHPRLIYDVEAPGLGFIAMPLLGLASVMATVVAAWLAVRDRSPLALSLAMIGILLVPFLQLIPFYTWSYASDRFLFLPIVGVGLGVGVGVSQLRGRVRLLAAAMLVLIALAGTTARAAQWRDGKILLADAFERSPHHRVAAELGIRWVLLPDHRFAEARDAANRVRVPGPRRYLQLYVDAREAMYRSDLTRLRPLVPPLLQFTQREDYSARLDVANMALESGLLAEGERAYDGILSDFPAALIVRYNRGLLLARQRRYAEAADAMQAAIDGGYVSATMLNNLGLARRNAGQPQPAVQAFRRALAVDQRHWHAGYNLARLLWAQGDRVAAREALHDARRRAVATGASTRPLEEVEAAMQ